MADNGTGSIYRWNRHYSRCLGDKYQRQWLNWLSRRSPVSNRDIQYLATDARY